MTIFLVGGGPAETLSSVHDQFVESARKRGVRVAVALLGSEAEVGGQLAGYADPITSRWPEAEIVPVWLDDEPDAAQNSTVWPERPEELAAIVVAGGWTPGYLEALRPHRDLLARLVRRGSGRNEASGANSPPDTVRFPMGAAPDAAHTRCVSTRYSHVQPILRWGR